MKKILLTVTLAAFVAFKLTACAPSESDGAPTKLVFAGIPMDGSTEITDSYQLMVDQLSKELKIPVELFEASDPVAMQAAFAAGKVDIASYAALDYWVQRKLTKNLELFAVSTTGEDAAPGNHALGFARANDSSINSIEDLKGKTVCFSDKTGGAYMASGYDLALLGMAPSEDGANGVTSNITGSAAASFYALKNNTCDMLFLIHTGVKSVFAKNLDLKESEFKQVYESGIVPGTGLIYSTKLDKKLRDRIKTITLSHLNKKYFVEEGLCEDLIKCKFLNITNWGYVAPPEGYYDPILKFCRKLDPANCPAG